MGTETGTEMVKKRINKDRLRKASIYDNKRWLLRQMAWPTFYLIPFVVPYH